MIVPTGIDELELTRLVEMPLRIFAGKQEALNLVGRVQRVAVLVVLLFGEGLQQAARVADMTSFFSISRGAEGERWGELIGRASCRERVCLGV